MKNNKKMFFLVEFILLIFALFFVWKIFDQNVPEKRVAVILPESGDKRWDSLIKGMKQSAKMNHIHLIICNTDEIENAEVEKEAIAEQKNNNIDAVIVWPAPGTDTKKMLKQECSNIPVVLIIEDLYSGEEQKKSDFPVVEPDYYKAGATLGKQVGTQKQTIGIVAGREESEAAVNTVRGFSDALKNTESQISWCYYQDKGQDVCAKVNKQEKVDTLVVLDPGALDQIGEQAEDAQSHGMKIYGIGTSEKAIALEDYGKIDGLVVPDGYEIGYKSVEEIAKKFKHRFYKLQSHEVKMKVIDKEEPFLDDDIERFLYSYE